MCCKCDLVAIFMGIYCADELASIVNETLYESNANFYVSHGNVLIQCIFILLVCCSLPSMTCYHSFSNKCYGCIRTCVRIGLNIPPLFILSLVGWSYYVVLFIVTTGTFLSALALIISLTGKVPQPMPMRKCSIAHRSNTHVL